MKAGRVWRALRAPARFAFVLPVLSTMAEQVPVRHLEGRNRGFLVLRDVNNKILASGSLIQFVNGNRVTNELSFRFKDGSSYQQTTVFSQQRTFQLVSYRLAQKGPAFNLMLDMDVNASKGQVTIHHTGDGQVKTISEQLKLPDDLANGMVTTLLGNLDSKTSKTTVSMLVATPKPRLVKLDLSKVGEEPFSVGGASEKSVRYSVKVDIGGLGGLIAPLVGKQPPDTQVWMVQGKAPSFLKSEGPLFQDGPVWRIEIASPVWPKRGAARKKR